MTLNSCMIQLRGFPLVQLYVTTVHTGRWERGTPPFCAIQGLLDLESKGLCHGYIAHALPAVPVCSWAA